jgi:HAD domain in Swiss Army Knife RNA repair proteins
MRAKEPSACDFSPTATGDSRPLLMVDIDGVISLFGFPGSALSTPRPGASQSPDAPISPMPNGSFHTVDGIPHFLSHAAAAHLQSLAHDFDLVWASGWEEKAEEYLPRLLGLPAGLPFLSFERSQGAGRSVEGHWKLDAIDAYAGTRPLAWIDDAFDESCYAWAAARTAPTLLVETEPAVGLTSTEAELLVAWATCERGRAETRAGG